MSYQFQIVCPHCGAINNTPEERLEENPTCGKCKKQLLPVTPITVDGAGLQKHIEHSGLPLMVDFWAPWCGPCLAFAPTYESFAQQVGYQLRCLKLDTEANQQAAAAYNIRSIPTLMLFRDGKEVDRVSGAMQPWQLSKWVLEKLAE